MMSFGASVAGADRSGAIKRWNSEDRGRIVFVSGIFNGLLCPAVCVMRIPSLELAEVITYPDSVRVDRDLCKWKDDHESVYLGRLDSQWGISLITRDRSSPLVLFPSHDLEFADPGLTVGSRDMENVKIATIAPRIIRVHYFELDIAVGMRTGTLYAHRYYETERDTASPTDSRGTSTIPRSTQDRIQRKLLASERRWTEIVAYDTSGKEKFITDVPVGNCLGIAVSPDERYIAYSGDSVLQLCDVQTGQFFSPVNETGCGLRSPAFSWDGRSLVAVGYGKKHESGSRRRRGLVVAHWPEFGAFSPLIMFREFSPLSFSWSPDGKWILLVVSKPNLPIEGPYDLVAYEVATGEYFELPRPYHLPNGSPAPQIYVDHRMDWTK